MISGLTRSQWLLLTVDSMIHRWRRLVLTSSMSKTRVPRVEPSPLARRVGLKIVVKSLCLSKNWKTHSTKKESNILKSILIISVSANNIVISWHILSFWRITKLIFKHRLYDWFLWNFPVKRINLVPVPLATAINMIADLMEIKVYETSLWDSIACQTLWCLNHSLYHLIPYPIYFDPNHYGHTYVATSG